MIPPQTATPFTTDGPGGTEGTRPEPAPRLARAVLLAVFGGFYLVAWARIVYASNDLSSIIVSAACITMIAILQIMYFSRPEHRLRSRVRFVALGAQAVLVYGPLLLYGTAWLGMPGFLAGSALLVLPARIAWLSFGLIVVSVTMVQIAFSPVLIEVMYIAVATAITGLVVYGLTRLANVVTELQEARMELASLAVSNERLRVSRDLHDLLGYSLSAITLKTELVRRTISTDQSAADKQLGEILEISRRALADVRAVSTGYRALSFDDEARAASSVLQAADVDVSADVEHPPIPEAVDTVLAMVLREAIANILRHATAKHSEIKATVDDSQFKLEITNDGSEPGISRRSARNGAGLRNLRERVTELGGTFNAGPGAEGTFRVRAEVPLRPTLAAYQGTTDSADGET